MEQYQEIIAVLAMTLGASWASGINLYATIAMLGIMAVGGAVDLPPDLEILQNPMVIATAGFMYCVEFFADKFPGVDTGWDAIHTFIRIPAGALLAAGAVGEVDPALQLAAAIVGGSMAATSHATKAGARAVINTSPEPVSNWTASVLEDVAVILGLWTALNHPILFLCLLFVFILLAIWLLPKIWRLIKAILAKIRGWLSGDKEQAAADEKPIENLEKKPEQAHENT